MRVKKFMKESYRNEPLVSNFYHQWDFGIHVELGGGHYQLTDKGNINMLMFQKAYRQVSQILALLFRKTDDVIVVVQSFPHETKQTVYPYLFLRYIKNQKKKYEIHLQEFNWTDEEEIILVQQMELFCKATDIKWEPLCKALIHEGFSSLRPRLRKKHSLFAPDVFLINTRTRCIFHLYDDRGCEIINADPTLHENLLQAIRSLKLCAEEEIQSRP
ncbi:MAG: hypothetical protein ACI33P_05200 [Lysinibacillus sp.]